MDIEYWLEVYNEKGKLMFQSIRFKSYNEAEQLDNKLEYPLKWYCIIEDTYKDILDNFH